MTRNQKNTPPRTNIFPVTPRDAAHRSAHFGAIAKLVAASVLGALLTGLPACVTPQKLPSLVLKGQVLDVDTRLPVSGAKVRLVYHGATKTLPAGKGESQFMEPIEVATAVSDATGRFVARAEERYVTRPLMDSWPSYPYIESSAAGYQKGILFDMDLSARYSAKHGVSPQIAWPYSDHVEIFIRREE